MVKKITPDADCTSLWPYPLESDGWYRAHNALRADMAAIASMLNTFQLQLALGKPVSRVQAEAAQRFVAAFLKFLHHHHHNEDEIATPYLATRFAVPDKIAADHRELDVLLDRFEADMKKLLGATLAPVQLRCLADVRGVFTLLRPMLLEHLREEEELAIPLMRKHFTPKEIEKNVIAKIQKSMDGGSLGVFFRAMTKEERRAFMRQEHVPFFVRWILASFAAQYERKVWRPFERHCLSVRT